MTKIQGILAAGTLTVTMLGALVGAGTGTIQVALAESPSEEATASSVELITEQEQMIAALQQREAQYAAQIEQANQIIAGLESTPSSDDATAQLAAANQTIADLQATLVTMQTRETEFIAQIETANQTIAQLQASVSQASAVASAPPHGHSGSR